MGKNKLRLFYKWFWAEGIFIFAAAVFLYFFSYAPVAINYRNAPKDRYYWGTSYYPLDTLGNLTTVREGYLGHIFRFSKITSTIPDKPLIVRTEYILIGHLARIAGIDPLVMFHLTRIVLSMVILAFIYFLIRNIFNPPSPRPWRGFGGFQHRLSAVEESPTVRSWECFNKPIERIAAFFLALFATSSLPPFEKGSEILFSIPEDAYVFFRLTTAAHHYLLGTFFSLVSLYLFSKAIERKKSFIFLSSATLSGIITGLIYAPAAVLILLCLPVFLALCLWKSSRENRVNMMVKYAGKILIFGLGALISLAYMRYIGQFWDLKTIAGTEKIIPFNPPFWQYFAIVGVTYFLSIAAVPYILKTGNTLLYIFLPWVIVHPLATNFLAPAIGVTKGRFFLSPHFVIFAIMSVFGIKAIGKKGVFLGLSLFVILLSGLTAYKTTLEKMDVCFCLADNFAFAYPKKGEIEAVNWLRDNTAENDIVLSGPFIGTIIPAFAGNRVYTSWWFYLTSPPNFPDTLKSWLRFYKEEMGDDEALVFLNDNKIAYVYLGIEERNNRQNVKNPYFSYPFLHKRFENELVAIYGVR